MERREGLRKPRIWTKKQRARFPKHETTEGGKGGPKQDGRQSDGEVLDRDRNFKSVKKTRKQT